MTRQEKIEKKIAEFIDRFSRCHGITPEEAKQHLIVQYTITCIEREFEDVD